MVTRVTSFIGVIDQFQTVFSAKHSPHTVLQCFYMHM